MDMAVCIKEEQEEQETQVRQHPRLQSAASCLSMFIVVWIEPSSEHKVHWVDFHEPANRWCTIASRSDFSPATNLYTPGEKPSWEVVVVEAPSRKSTTHL
jgi:hypothetical protein